MPKLTPRIFYDQVDKRQAHLLFECDCACQAAGMEMVNPASTNKLGAAVFPLQDDWYVLHNPLGSPPFSVVNQAAYDLWQECLYQGDRSIDESMNREFLQKLVTVGLIQSDPRPTRDQAQTAPQRHLSAWLHLTDRCNLRCAYCYLPHLREDMTLETGRAAISATFRSALKHGIQNVTYKYAGGEPLLRCPLLLELHQHAQRLAQENGIILDGVVLSNGTLLDESIANDLRSNGLRLMISLDGMGDWHNTQRPYAGGSSSFDDVLRGVEIALAAGLSPHISITVSGRNAEGLAEIIRWVLLRDLSFNINFYRQNDRSASSADLKLDQDKIISGMKAAFRVIEQHLPSRSLLGAMTDRANLAMPHTRTCSAGDNYLVFNQNGQVSKCQMQMNTPVSCTEAEDSLELIQKDQDGVHNISVEEKEGCRDCQWKYWCAGGCPIETFRSSGRYDVRSPHCHIYQTIFPEVLRLEGLRLLKLNAVL